MKQGNNNEVDLLLRSLAKERDASLSRSGSSVEDATGSFSDHLDADELSSYAEGVVPPPARVRYMDHLADCEACRGIVISLTQAAGVTGRREVRQQEGGTSFWQKLAALFSPAVLRFAVPALVLTFVIGIGLLALRQRNPNEFLARRNGADSQTATNEPRDNRTAPNSSTGATPPSSSVEDQPTTKSGLSKQEETLQAEKGGVAQGQIGAADSNVAKPSALKDSTQPGEGAAVATGRDYAPEPKAAAPPSSVMTEEVDKSVVLAKERPAKRADQQIDREEDSRNRDEVRNQPSDDDGHGPYRGRNNTALPAANERNLGVTGGRGPNAEKKKVGEVETRSVSGRRFTREDNMWVDTDYDAPRSTIKVARGSDQFRALVADEPGLRAIADELNGIVIVVWKNRAYRIQ